MRIVGTFNGGSQESVFYSNTNRGRGRGGKTSFQGRHGSSHGGHHQHEGQAHGGGRGNLGGRGSRGSLEVVVDVIEVNNEIAIQIATTMGNLGTWQRTVIKGSMMHEMQSYNKGIMHQLVIKVMSNCL